MKFLTLKTKLNKGLFLLSLITAVSITENAFGAVGQPQVNNDPEAQIANVLERCLFAQNEKNSFSFYVDELIRIVTIYKNQLEAKFGTVLVDRFSQDMTNIKNSKKAIEIGKTLARYKNFMPSSLKRKKPLELLVALKKRLAYSNNSAADSGASDSGTADSGASDDSAADYGTADQAETISNDTYLNAFVGYCKLLVELGKEYCTQ